MTKVSTHLLSALLSVATTTGLVAFADPASAVSRVAVPGHPAVIATIVQAGVDHRG